MPHFAINQHVLVNLLLFICIGCLWTLSQMGVPVGAYIAPIAAFIAAYNGWTHGTNGGH